MSRILVTGASGFIGSALVSALAAEGLAVRAAYRARPANSHTDSAVVGELGPRTDWGAALEGVTQIVHLAGPAHKRADDETYRREIVQGTDALAAQAKAAGVTRFLFMSSIKAAADRGGPLTERDTPTPGSIYGRAKLEAERIVLARPALNPVALRPPLVHAPNAKANFALLLRLAASPLPLPLGGIHNKRSVIALSTLIDAVRAVLRAPDGPAGAYLVADQPALSISQIVAALRAGMGRSPGLFPTPFQGLLPAALREDLFADDSAFRAAYSFAPASDAHDLLRRCGAAWARA